MRVDLDSAPQLGRGRDSLTQSWGGDVSWFFFLLSHLVDFEEESSKEGGKKWWSQLTPKECALKSGVGRKKRERERVGSSIPLGAGANFRERTESALACFIKGWHLKKWKFIVYPFHMLLHAMPKKENVRDAWWKLSLTHPRGTKGTSLFSSSSSCICNNESLNWLSHTHSQITSNMYHVEWEQ